MGSDPLLLGQIAYYRRRADEYDETSVGDVTAASREFASLVQRLAPSGDVLEVACGTGLWTQHLVPCARTLTALDSSSEMIELARTRVGDVVDFVVADVFQWKPPRRYDSIFFGFWLSHVPPTRFGAFWQLLERCLTPGGRVLFVDEGPSRASREEPDRCLIPQENSAQMAVNAQIASGGRAAPRQPERAPTVMRRLRDGSLHTIVKVFYEPTELAQALAELGWSPEVALTSEGFIIGTARPV